MGSFKNPRSFSPLDLEILDLSKDDERKKKRRQWIFALADNRPVDFDALLDKLATAMRVSVLPLY